VHRSPCKTRLHLCR